MEAQDTVAANLLRRFQQDPTIKAVVVTDDGSVAVCNETTRKVAERLLHLAGDRLEEDE